MDISQHSIIEAASRAADINQVTVLIQADQQRTEIFPGTFRRSESANNEVVRLQRLDLQPVFGAALLVFALLVLGDYPFETMLFDSFEKLHPATFNMIGKTNPPVIVRNQFAEDRLPLFQRKFR